MPLLLRSCSCSFASSLLASVPARAASARAASARSSAAAARSSAARRAAACLATPSPDAASDAEPLRFSLYDTRNAASDAADAAPLLEYDCDYVVLATGGELSPVSDDRELADGTIVDEVFGPTPDTVLDRMKALG